MQNTILKSSILGHTGVWGKYGNGFNEESGICKCVL